ncbi:hypothetical protein NC651_031761 [Populus alba x Populus x berolinensis]|nr:hypothetical protein NC651_031761 [Populus alba x Populus x berolinensis]
MIAKTGTCDNCCDPDSCLKNDLATVITSEYLARKSIYQPSVKVYGVISQQLLRILEIKILVRRLICQPLKKVIRVTLNSFFSDNDLADVALLEVSPELLAEIEGLSKQEHSPSPSLDQLPVCLEGSHSCIGSSIYLIRSFLRAYTFAPFP